MFFDRLKKRILEGNCAQHVMELLQGPADQFVCEGHELETSTFIIVNNAQNVEIRVSIFPDNHEFIPVDALISSTECESDYFEVPFASNEEYGSLIGAVLLRLSKETLLAWLTRNMSEQGICLSANVKKGCTWFISFDYFELYGTQNGVFIRDRCQRAKLNDIPLPLTLADLKPLLIAYHEILDAHRWDDMIEWTREEQIENMFKDALKKHAKRVEQEKKAGWIMEEVDLSRFPMNDETKALKRKLREMNRSESDDD